MGDSSTAFVKVGHAMSILAEYHAVAGLSAGVRLGAGHTCGRGAGEDRVHIVVVTPGQDFEIGAFDAGLITALANDQGCTYGERGNMPNLYDRIAAMKAEREERRRTANEENRLGRVQAREPSTAGIHHVEAAPAGEEKVDRGDCGVRVVLPVFELSLVDGSTKWPKSCRQWTKIGRATSKWSKVRRARKLLKTKGPAPLSQCLREVAPTPWLALKIPWGYAPSGFDARPRHQTNQLVARPKGLTVRVS